MKLTGPMFSMSASGTLAGLLTIVRNRGRHSVRRHFKPTDRQSFRQMNNRSLVGFLQAAWNGIPTEKREQWGELATELGLPNYQAFVSGNLHDWTDSHGPTDVPSPEPAAPTSAYIDSLIGGAGNITGRFIEYGGGNSWAGALYVYPDAPPLAKRSNIRLMLQPILGSPGVTLWIIRDLAPGNYRVASQTWGRDGVPGIYYLDPNLIVVT